MKTAIRLAFSLLLLVSGRGTTLAQQEIPQQTFRLNDWLITVAKTNRIAVQAEIALPMPEVSFSTSDLKNESLLSKALLKQLPDYVVRWQGGILFVANRTLMRSTRNPMNAILTTFSIPPTLDELSHSLPNRAKKALTGDKAEGGLMNGLGTPGTGPSLKPEVLTNTSIRNVIARAASELKPFVSIIVVPSSFRTAKAIPEDSFWQDWEILADERLDSYRSHCCYGELKRGVATQ